MDYTDVEIFLEVVKSHSFSKAAKNMYIAQSTVSHRMNKLESELEGRLFLRSKGQNTLELTEKGRLFVPNAERWAQIFDETKLLKEQSCGSIGIACNESSYMEMVGAAVERFTAEFPQIRVAVKICDSPQVCEQVEKREADLGFASVDAVREGIRTRLVREQPFCVIRYGEGEQEEPLIHPAELRPEEEVRFIGGYFRTIEAWRRKWLGGSAGAACRAEFNSLPAALGYMKVKGGWALYSLPAARILRKSVPVRIYRLTEPPEARAIHLVMREREAENQTVIEDFLRVLEEGC